jgi:hypothetical protein
MRHAKRSVLTTEDINAALRLRNVEARCLGSARTRARSHALGLRAALACCVLLRVPGRPCHATARCAAPHAPCARLLACCALVLTRLRLPSRSRHEQPVYGWQGGREPVEYMRAEGYPDLLFMKDREVNLEEEARAHSASARTQTRIARLRLR